MADLVTESVDQSAAIETVINGVIDIGDHNRTGVGRRWM